MKIVFAGAGYSPAGSWRGLSSQDRSTGSVQACVGLLSPSRQDTTDSLQAEPDFDINYDIEYRMSRHAEIEESEE